MSRRSDEETIQAILDGKLDARSFEAFERRLLAEPALREMYRSYSHMTHVLEEKFAHSEPKLVAFKQRSERTAAFIAPVPWPWSRNTASQPLRRASSRGSRKL